MHNNYIHHDIIQRILHDIFCRPPLSPFKQGKQHLGQHRIYALGRWGCRPLAVAVAVATRRCPTTDSAEDDGNATLGQEVFLKQKQMKEGAGKRSRKWPQSCKQLSWTGKFSIFFRGTTVAFFWTLLELKWIKRIPSEENGPYYFIAGEVCDKPWTVNLGQVERTTCSTNCHKLPRDTLQGFRISPGSLPRLLLNPNLVGLTWTTGCGVYGRHWLQLTQLYLCQLCNVLTFNLSSLCLPTTSCMSTSTNVVSMQSKMSNGTQWQS